MPPPQVGGVWRRKSLPLWQNYYFVSKVLPTNNCPKITENVAATAHSKGLPATGRFSGFGNRIGVHNSIRSESTSVPGKANNFAGSLNQLRKNTFARMRTTIQDHVDESVEVAPKQVFVSKEGNSSIDTGTDTAPDSCIPPSSPTSGISQDQDRNTSDTAVIAKV